MSKHFGLYHAASATIRRDSSFGRVKRPVDPNTVKAPFEPAQAGQRSAPASLCYHDRISVQSRTQSLEALARARICRDLRIEIE